MEASEFTDAADTFATVTVADIDQEIPFSG